MLFNKNDIVKDPEHPTVLWVIQEACNKKKTYDMITYSSNGSGWRKRIMTDDAAMNDNWQRNTLKTKI